MWRIRRIHPLLFVAFPIFFLFQKNVGNFPGEVMLLPLALGGLYTMAFSFLLGRVLESPARADIITSCAALLFFSFGHVENLIGGETFTLFGNTLHTERVMLFFFGLTLALAVLAVLRAERDPTTLADVFIVAGLSLVIPAAIQIAPYITRAPNEVVQVSLPERTPLASTGDSLPDIYYVVVDAYGRQDVLKEIYGFDNAPFLDAIRSMGFYVANQARSNYGQTLLSLTSSLNGEYLDTLMEALPAASDDRTLLSPLLHQNRTRLRLAQLGYRFVAFSNGSDAIDIKDADVYVGLSGNLNEFTRALVDLTPLYAILNLFFTETAFQPIDTHRARILNVLDKLPLIAKLNEPTFAFAHILAPHPPFVFSRTGESVEPVGGEYMWFDGSGYIGPTKVPREHYMNGYIQQVEFINARLLTCLKELLENSPRPPIIILQGDHGPGAFLDHRELAQTNVRERFSILNAYYLPDGASQLYPGISPVNSFRFVMKQYFGADLPLLEDRSFYGTWNEPYRLTEVTDQLDHTASHGSDGTHSNAETREELPATGAN